ncbi:MAG: hypothetical protein H6618_08830 [Deltaproteobacteria bacterium]|nr:hypothetical protein [Deltaproteobacteria bacterium]
MKQTYIDKLTEAEHVNGIWKLVSLVCFAVISIQAFASIYLSTKLVSNVDRIRYVLAPGVQTFTTVRPGELPSSYIEEAFRFITDRLNGWSYDSVKDNYKTLFTQFYDHGLTERTQANLKSLNYFEDIESRKLVSLWQVDSSESQYEWCGNVPVRGDIRGVACGIVSGTQRLYAEHSIPVSQTKVHYLIYAVNVAPTANNFFALQIMRVKRGPLQALKAELENSLKNGVLPSEDHNEII